MHKLDILLASFIGVLGLSLPRNINGMILNDTTDTRISHKNNDIDKETMAKPNALAPTYELQNANSDSIFNTDYFAPYYFSNLKGRFGNNVKGSCTYVAVDMLLSYYDSFWNDNFLPEKYDGENVFVNETILNATESPGSKNEADVGISTNNLSDEEYLNLVNNHKDDIVHFDLLSRGIEKLNLYNEDKKILSLSTSLSNVRDVIYDYLDESISLSRDDIKIGFKNSNPTKMRETIIENVSKGIPVIIDARDREDSSAEDVSAHSFLAYDYDEINDEIYCNAGWYGSSYSHISMTDLGFPYIQEIMYFEPTIEHEHSFNYSRYDEYGDTVEVCACTSMIPTEIEIFNNYLDVSPTFKWNSLIKEKWSEKDNLYHTLSILRNNKNEAFKIVDIFDNECILTTQVWKNVINDVADPSYYVYIAIDSETCPNWGDYYCSALFREPNRYSLKSSFLPEDWGFEGRYYFSNELNSSSVASDPDRMYTTVTQNKLTIDTERLRCGYIEESYIVLSPRRENAGRAYFEMNFNKPVYSFMYRACMWSASENLDGTAIIQTKDVSGNWSTLKDIPISSLKTKENGLTQFAESTLTGIYGLRFETTATATGDRNKGRFCLGDIVFSTSLLTAMKPFVNYDYSL
ncbi:MAG: hypothetical protein PUC70_00990 [bacterium]|nr:hypothetical protein [bacterium]